MTPRHTRVNLCADTQLLNPKCLHHSTRGFTTCHDKLADTGLNQRTSHLREPLLDKLACSHHTERCLDLRQLFRRTGRIHQDWLCGNRVDRLFDVMLDLRWILTQQHGVNANGMTTVLDEIGYLRECGS